MPTTITYTGGTLPTPSTVMFASHDWDAETGTIIHELMGGGITYTLRNASTNSATLHLAYSTYSDAKTAYSALKTASVFSYTNTDSSVTMSFVVAGTMQLRQSVEGGSWWTVECDIREVI